MHPIANPFYALSGLVQSMHAELATKYSFAVTMYPFQSACSAIPPLHILTFSNSDSPRPSSPDLSQDTRKTFYSLKNLPCFQPHKPPSHMNDYYTTFICNYATFTPKSNNLTISNTIFSLLKIIYYDRCLFFIYILYIIAINTMITRTRRRKRQQHRRSRRFAFDPACWGKNKPLEQLWHDLSHFLSVVIVYNGTKPYEIISPVSAEQLRALNANPSVVAILTSHPDVHNAYETLVYPRAKDKTVDYVITHYDKIFKRIPARVHPMFKDATHMTMHKLRAPIHTKYE